MSDELIGIRGEQIQRAFVSFDNPRTGFRSVDESIVQKHVSDENSSGLTWHARFTDYSALRTFRHSNNYRF